MLGEHYNSVVPTPGNSQSDYTSSLPSFWEPFRDSVVLPRVGTSDGRLAARNSAGRRRLDDNLNDSNAGCVNNIRSRLLDKLAAGSPAINRHSLLLLLFLLLLALLLRPIFR